VIVQFGIPSRSKKLDCPRIKCESSHNIDISDLTLQSTGGFALLGYRRYQPEHYAIS
jgi:hypothetical protein